MKKKRTILIIIIPMLIIFIGWFIFFRNTDDVSASIGIEIPAGSKYITKDKNIGGFPPDGIDYFVVRIPSEKNNEFITNLMQNQWIEYDEKDYDFYFNNWIGKILNYKIPLQGIESGWLVLIDGNHSIQIDINISREILTNFVFAVYDPSSCTLYVMQWMD